jgi:hypothetical protein
MSVTEPVQPGVETVNQEKYYGCIPLDKADTIVTEGGSPTVVDYIVRDASGVPVDLSGLFNQDNPGGEDDPNGLFIGFALADNTLVSKQPVPGTVTDAKNGRVQFTLPDFIIDVPCLYSFWTAVGAKETAPSSGRYLYIAPKKGIVLVEWTPFNAHFRNCPVKHRVVPALEDIRRTLDDFEGKNDLLGQVEFSNDDIVHAMVNPIRIFNEMPPRLQRFRYGLMTFPYYHQWVQGTAAELLRIAAMHYTRNKLLTSHGGLQGDEKNRDKEYLQYASAYMQEFREFCRLKKHELNFSGGQGWGTLHSDYIFQQHWR